MLVYQNIETGEIFETREAAVEDAEELYDYGDPTNPIAFDELPYETYDDVALMFHDENVPGHSIHVMYPYTL